MLTQRVPQGKLRRKRSIQLVEARKLRRPQAARDEKGTYKFSCSKCQVILVTMQSTLRNKCVVEGTKVLKMTVLKGQ